MKQVTFNGIALLMLAFFSNTINGAATSESEDANRTWREIVASGIWPEKLSSTVPLAFKNNTNVAIAVIFQPAEGTPQKLTIEAGQTGNLTQNANTILSTVGVTVTQGIVPGGSNLYGLQTFDLQAALDALAREQELSPYAPVVLTLERQPGYFGIPSLTFKITATQPAPEVGSSHLSIGSGEFEQLPTLAHATEQLLRMGDLKESDFVFYNGSLGASVALEYYQNEKYHKIIVPNDETVFLGKNIGAEFFVTRVSVFGGDVSPIPMVAQLYQTHTFDIPSLVGTDKKVHPIYQINIPKYLWSVWIDPIDAIPTDAITAKTAEQDAIKDSQSEYEGRTAFQLYGFIDRYKVAAFATDKALSRVDQIDIDRWSDIINSINTFALDRTSDDQKDQVEKVIDDLNLTQTFILDSIKTLSNRKNTLSVTEAQTILDNAKQFSDIARVIENNLLTQIKGQTEPSFNWVKRIPAENILEPENRSIFDRYNSLTRRMGAVSNQELKRFLADNDITDSKQASNLIENLEKYLYRNQRDENAKQLVSQLYALFPDVLTSYIIDVTIQSQDKTAMILYAQAGAYSGILKKLMRELSTIIARQI